MSFLRPMSQPQRARIPAVLVPSHCHWLAPPKCCDWQEGQEHVLFAPPVSASPFLATFQSNLESLATP